jgi:hypothetical protein
VARRILSAIRQHETHRQLVGRPARGSWRATRTGPDAIIVPASRTADNLDHAITLAQAAACCLVVLCSRDARASEVETMFSDRHFIKGVAVDLPDGYRHPLLSFATSDLARGRSQVCVNPNGDLSIKRNLGLLIARMLGWNRIFFMDDDVRGVSLEDLRTTVSMLGRFRSVGMRVTDTADNSVVCHAHRATGADQDVFVSGSVLAVNCRGPVAFFPEVYNEDWFFFYDDVCAGRVGWSGCNATQLRYDPFDNVQRAERQEFGDVLAEGLYALLHTESCKSETTRNYWNKFLAARKEFLESIIRRADSVPPEIGQNIVRAVQTAMLCLLEIEDQTCEDYVKAWRRDLEDWTERLESLPRFGSLEAALEELNLNPDHVGRPVAATVGGGVSSLEDMLNAAPFAGRTAILTRQGALLAAPAALPALAVRLARVGSRWTGLRQIPRGQSNQSRKSRAAGSPPGLNVAHTTVVIRQEANAPLRETDPAATPPASSAAATPPATGSASLC